jgi:hypothetical protein
MAGQTITAELQVAEIHKWHRAGVAKAEIARGLQIGRTSVRRLFLKEWIRNVNSLSGCCDHCNGTFRYRLIHNGFSDSAYGYCSSCSSTVLLSGWNPVAQRVGLAIHQRITPQIEALLKRCPCGDRFRASADPKCPHCTHTLSASEATAYIERDAPGAKKGWRWQQSWSGIYSIVLNDHFLEDWWDEDALSACTPPIAKPPKRRPRPIFPERYWHQCMPAESSLPFVPCSAFRASRGYPQ